MSNQVGKGILAATLLGLAACVSGPATPQLTPLQIETLQTREYEADKDVVFASVVSVFQTLGYSLDEADKDTGIITASGLSQVETPGFMDSLFSGILEATIMGTNSSSSRPQQVKRQKTSRSRKATAFIEQWRQGITRVRINFVEHAVKGGDKQSKRILNSKVYQEAFEKIGTALFVRTGQKDFEGGGQSQPIGKSQPINPPASP